MKILLLILSILPGALLAQVGINTTTPTKTLDVNGEMRIRIVPQGDTTDNILVVDSQGNIRKLPISSLQVTNSMCPNLHNTSTGYYLLFTSTSSIPNPNNSLVISGKTFVSAGTWISNNTYYYSYTNTSGQPININSFSVDFTNLHCTYH